MDLFRRNLHKNKEFVMNQKLFVLSVFFVINSLFSSELIENSGNIDSFKIAGQVIYLNGPSSVGKSTLARALQNALQVPFLVLGIDQIIFMMPDKCNDWSNESLASGFSWQTVKDEQNNAIAHAIHVGPFGKQMVQAFKEIVVSLVKSGLNVIVDDVSFGKEEVDAWKTSLKEVNVLWVGVTAPIEILEQREKDRGDRKIGSAKWQAERVHCDVQYDVVINSHEKSIDENVKKIQNIIEG